MQSTGYTIKQYAHDKKLPSGFLKAIGLRNATLNKRTVVAIPYYDKDKNIIALRYRHALKDRKRFSWKPDTKVTLYGVENVTITAVARKLSIDNSAAFRRIKTATMRGFLVNLETRPYRSARIVMGDTMPYNQSVLPTAEEVCRFDAELEGRG